MKPTQRKTYFSLWLAACKAQGWDKGDEKRQEITGFVMTQIRAPFTTSTTNLKEPQITALFTYLILAADSNNIEKNAAWVECCRDYVSFNQLRQAKYWERSAGFKGRIRKQRFGGRIADSSLDEPTARKDVKEYLLTARNAALAKAAGKPRKQFHKKPVEDTGLRPRNEPDVPIINGIPTPW